MKKSIETVLDTGAWCAHEAQSLTRRLSFSKSLVSGKHLSFSLGILYERACAGSSVHALSNDEKEALRSIGRYLDRAEPMKIPYQGVGLLHVL